MLSTLTETRLMAGLAVDGENQGENKRVPGSPVLGPDSPEPKIRIQTTAFDPSVHSLDRYVIYHGKQPYLPDSEGAGQNLNSYNRRLPGNNERHLEDPVTSLMTLMSYMILVRKQESQVDSLPYQIIDMLHSVLNYWHDPTVLPQLGYCERVNRATGEFRLKRKERRLMHCKLLIVLIAHTDYSECRVGYWKGSCGNYIHHSLTDLAWRIDELDAEGKPTSGFKEAWKELVARGVVVQILDRRVDEKGCYRSKESIKVLVPQALIQLGGVTRGSLSALEKTARRKIKQQIAQGKRTFNRLAEAAKARAGAMKHWQKQFKDALAPYLAQAKQQQQVLLACLREKYPGEETRWYNAIAGLHSIG